MASVEHLETMGRELKCPICLSLLCSAVSLACNHVFCSACICKSMKSASYCPVCKVPYHRREVRPSPHMDNLVNIYKNMEAAAGVNIFVTQKEPVNKNSDGPVNCEDGKNRTLQHTKQKCQIMSRKRKITKNTLNNKAISETVVTNPSKKRVHVTPYPISETPCRPDVLGKHYFPNSSCQIHGGLVNHVVDKTRDVSIVSKEKSHSEDMGVPTFDPFFWLREDVNEDGDSEKASTQKSEDMASHHAPCFSDIKDTDDCNPATMTPMSKLYAGRLLDSELFEWTQRACSPELCLTPARNKVKYENGLDKTGEEHERASFSGFPDGNEISNSSSKRRRRMDDEVNKQSTNCCLDNQGKNSIKRKQRANAQGKNDERITYEGKKTCLDSVYPDDKNNDSGKMAGSGSVDGKRQNKMSSTRKSKKVGGSQMRSEHLKKVQDYATVEGFGQISTECTEAKSCAQQANSEDLQHQKASTNESDTSCINRKRSTRARLKKNKGTVLHTMAVIPEFTSKLSSKKQIKFPVSKSFVTESSDPNSTSNRNKSHRLNHMIEQKKQGAAFNWQGQMMTDNADGICEGTSVVEKSHKSIYRGNKDENAENINLDKKKREIKMHKKMAEQIKELKTAEVVEKALVDPIAGCGGKIRTRASNLKENEKNDIVENPMMSFGELHVNKDLSLRKCSDAPLPSHPKCAFCHSTEETEVTGDMMHYFEGKPVSADHNGGSSIIHTHKNCAEWAPNVYFQNDSAVNLKRELSRSKRIKCSCCGIKGAALGCFEKSCHKSFHYTCAKLIKQCRWDAENFVMLCPLHPLSKLPCETSESHGMRRQYKPTNECKMQESILSQLSVRQLQRWPSGSHLKYVLCCSALSSVEKEVVSKFAKMTGFSMSKDWSPHVTHVIASTDENGACKRTIKVLMAITEGKWVLKCDWAKVSMKVGVLQDEKQYEIEVDVHGIRDGPRLGRLRATEQKPKIFNGFKFYFSGDFTASYKGYLQDLVIAAGGTVLQRKPITREKEKLHDMTSESHLFIIYSLELNEKGDSGQDSSTLNRRKAEAEAIAGISGAEVATNTCILDSIAGCRLQSVGNC